MKRFKITFGITTAILSIVGIAAAKHYGSTLTRWYITSGGFYCVPIPSNCLGNSGTLTCIAFYTDGSPLHLFMSGVVFTKGFLVSGHPWVAIGQNCTSRLTYDGSF
ncbi:MAG: hypothetical protein J0H74_22380 [Chitinophagaceae bacterium]|nr:hypothetical protein [Chitinophagaceae bacterium]